MHDFFCNYIWGSQELWISMRAVGVTVINFSALRIETNLQIDLNILCYSFFLLYYVFISKVFSSTSRNRNLIHKMFSFEQFMVVISARDWDGRKWIK